MLSYVKQEKKMQLSVIWDLLAGQISCSAQLSMKKAFNLGARIYNRQ